MVEVACATNPFPPVVKGRGVVEVACATNPFPPLVKGGNTVRHEFFSLARSVEIRRKF